MANKILNTPMDGTPKQLVFANHAGDFSPTAANDLRVTTDASWETDVELVLLNLADAAAAQSAKADLGAKFATGFNVRACMEWQVAAADAGGIVEFYWSESHHATPATANTGGASGSAGPYAGYSSDLADAVGQLIFIGIMKQTDDAVDSVQIGSVGILVPTNRYGSLIVKNEAGQTLCDTNDIEAHVVFDPIVDEIQ